MASDEFYISMGIIAFIILAFGGIGLQGNYSIPWASVSGYLILIGIVFVGIIGVGAYRDIKSRVKDWNAEHKYTELDQRETELALKEREMEIREREEQLKKASEPQIKKENITKTEISQTEHVTPEIKLDEKYFQDNFNDEPILKTGDSSFDGLYTSKQSSGLSDEDYQKLIYDSLHLKALWYISKHPNRYRNPFDLYSSFDEEFDRKSRIYDVMADDHFPKLITNLATKDKREGYILSPLGQHLLEKAKQEKIVTWDQFTKQFDEELKTGIIKQTTDAKPPSIRISSNDAEIARLFAEAKPYYGKKKDKKIISIMDKILQIDPENVIALSNKGHALSMLDQLDDAEKHFDLALKINPEHVYAIANKAGLYIERNPEHAIELFQKSLKIEEDPHTYSGIATAYANLKRFEDALHYVNKALDLLDVNDPYGQREHALELKHNIEDDLRKQR